MRRIIIKRINKTAFQRLGKNQVAVLDALVAHHHWFDGCGWIWNTHSETVRILDSLVKRGFVVCKDGKYFPYGLSQEA